MPLRTWPSDPGALALLGVRRVESFCRANGVTAPPVRVIARDQWGVDACAYYRPDTGATREWMVRLPGGQGPGINVCLAHCGRPCGHETTRNWSWPGNVTDREPYGVVCHELGHHCDWLAGGKKGAYWSDYCERVKARSGFEAGLTSYAGVNPAEWFAEAFRLFVTNPGLLKQVRPRTFAVLSERWKPVGSMDWQAVLGANVPDRVVRSLINKGARRCL